MNIIQSPLEVPYAFSKKRNKDVMFHLNLNVFRNSHYRVINLAKIKYKEVITKQINSLPKYEVVGIIYEVHMKTKRAYDVSNVCSIHSKFFLDALVELGKLKDDNYNFLPIEVYSRGTPDKDNPRVDIHLFDLSNQEDRYIFMRMIGGKIGV